MKLREIKEDNAKYPLKPKETFKKKELPVFAFPIIKENERVRLLPKYEKGNEDRIIGKVLTVSEIYSRSLDNITAYFVKFKETGNSPFLAHYFYKVEDEG